MANELSGKVMLILPEQTGTGKNGQWSKQDFVIETEEQYPKKVCFSAWGEKVAQVKALQADARVKVSFNIESREFNGKWYTDLRIWKIEKPEQAVTPEGVNTATDFGPEPVSRDEGAGEPDDLPF
jgi:hypothetical protein